MGCIRSVELLSLLVVVSLLYFNLLCFHLAKAQIVEGSVSIDGQSHIAETDENFICATLDWWPPEKCDYGTCSWDHASLLNLDLNNSVLFNAVKAFSPLKIRLGGTLQDKVIYQTGDSSQPCVQFAKNASELFGFTQGCLPLTRWDELNSFFNKSGASVIFGLNALSGKNLKPDNTARGPWNSSNAKSLIQYTVEKGYTVYGWELGNELSGRGIGVGIDADTYASDTIALHDMVQDVYKGVSLKPQIIAPGGFFDPEWYRRFLVKTNGSLHAITHHIYNLGPGSDAHLIDRVLDPSVLDGGAGVFKNLRNVIANSANRVSAWVGEAGGAYNSGRDRVTNAFVFSFWYLDQLGLASMYDTKVYCRQSLVGGNYGLLNTTTFVPNPDYYSALLWHRLMGKYALSTNFTGSTRKVRAYAHCAKQSGGVTLLVMNLDGNTTARVKVNITTSMMSSLPETEREEYHLAAKGGDVQTQTVLLNGKELSVVDGFIADFEPVLVDSSSPIQVDPYGIVFVHMPDAAVPACASSFGGSKVLYEL